MPLTYKIKVEKARKTSKFLNVVNPVNFFILERGGQHAGRTKEKERRA